MPFQSAVEQLWTAGAMQDSLLELDPLHSTILPLWQHLKLPKAWEGDGDSSIPNYCGAAAMHWAATTQQWLYIGRGWEAEGPGPKCREGSNGTSLSWGPSLASGHTLVNSFSTGEQQETFGIGTFRAEICSRQMGKLIDSWTAGATKG